MNTHHLHRPHRPHHPPFRGLGVILLLALSLFFHSCKDDPIIGSITFTASHNCDVRLFDSQGREIAHVTCDLTRQPAVVEMTRSGLFVVLAECPGKESVKESLPYPGGDIQHYIQF